MSDRREFLKFLAGSPLLLAYPALLDAFTQAPTAQAARLSKRPQRRPAPSVAHLRHGA